MNLLSEVLRRIECGTSTAHDAGFLAGMFQDSRQAATRAGWMALGQNYEALRNIVTDEIGYLHADAFLSGCTYTVTDRDTKAELQWLLDTLRNLRAHHLQEIAIGATAAAFGNPMERSP